MKQMLSDERIIAIADATKTAEPGTDGYILPISFARAIEREVRESAPSGEAGEVPVPEAVAWLMDTGDDASWAEVGDDEPEAECPSVKRVVGLVTIDACRAYGSARALLASRSKHYEECAAMLDAMHELQRSSPTAHNAFAIAAASIRSSIKEGSPK
jgi:hypothetical protein